MKYKFNKKSSIGYIIKAINELKIQEFTLITAFSSKNDKSLLSSITAKKAYLQKQIAHQQQLFLQTCAMPAFCAQ